MITKIIIVAVLLGIFALGFWAIPGLAKESHERHAEIDELEKRAEAATELKDIELIWEDMKEINKKCFGHPFSTRISVVAAVLKTKHQMLTLKK